jgi:hypothetical protein
VRREKVKKAIGAVDRLRPFSRRGGGDRGAKGTRLVLIVVLIGVIPITVWKCRPSPDLLSYGKPERFWIENLLSGCDWAPGIAEDQVDRWRKFGPEGVGMLVRMLEKADRPWERTCRTIHRNLNSRLPGGVARLLPAPPVDSTSGIRERAAEVLWRLGDDARSAAPAMGRALKDEDPTVRWLAIQFFTAGGAGGEDALLNRMPENDKGRLLPDFIRALREGEGLNDGAAVALGYFAGQRDIVAPVLMNELLKFGLRAVPFEDWTTAIPEMGAASSRAWAAARASLIRVAPDALTRDGIVPLLIQVMKDPRNEVATAAKLLGELRLQPERAVPALIENLRITDAVAAAAAAEALLEFKEHADVLIPPLRKAARRDGAAGGFAKAVLNRLEYEIAANPTAR